MSNDNKLYSEIDFSNSKNNNVYLADEISKRFHNSYKFQ